MFLYYKYVQWRSKHGQLFCSVLLFKVLRGVFFFIVIRILLLKNIIKGVASAKHFLLWVSSPSVVFHLFISHSLPLFLLIAAAVRRVASCAGGILSFLGEKQAPHDERLFSPRLHHLLTASTTCTHLSLPEKTLCCFFPLRCLWLEYAVCQATRLMSLQRNAIFFFSF